MTPFAWAYHRRSLDHRTAAVEWNLRRALADPSPFNLGALAFHARALTDAAERALAEARA